MRSILAGSSLTVLLLVAGCNVLGPHGRTGPNGPSVAADPNAIPPADALVRYLNQNSTALGDRVLKCKNLSVDCKANGQSVGLGGWMMCQNPRNFRMSAKVVGQPAADIGSNNEEFWYWISKNEPPYLFHCSYDALSRGVNIGFPFQPEMVVAALGIAHYDPSKNYEVKAPPKANYFELIESTKSPRGEAIQKVVVFNRDRVDPPAPQVIAYVLRDGTGKTICTANVRRVQRNRETGAVIPQAVEFKWPGQNLEMKLELNSVEAESMSAERVGQVFSRRGLSYPAFDIAARALDAPAGVQRAGATLPSTMR